MSERWTVGDTAAAATPELGDPARAVVDFELSDEDLEHVVGGLARLLPLSIESEGDASKQRPSFVSQ